MAYYDENGNLIGESGDIPIIPTPAPRDVTIEIQDGTPNSTFKAKVDEDGNLQVKVTDMPAITIDTTGLTVNVEVENQVEITNDEGNPIPVEISGTPNVNATIRWRSFS